MSNTIKAIQEIYPDIKGGFVYWETKQDGTPWDNPIDGLVWENTEYNKPSWAEIESKLGGISLKEVKDKKLEELGHYHHSDETRTISIEGHNVKNEAEFRTLIDEQKDRFSEKLSLGLITEPDAIFTYQYNGSGLIPINLLQLRQLSVALKDIADVNYNVWINHRNVIKELTSIEEVDAYDIKANYLINQSLSL